MSSWVFFHSTDASRNKLACKPLMIKFCLVPVLQLGVGYKNQEVDKQLERNQCAQCLGICGISFGSQHSS